MLITFLKLTNLSVHYGRNVFDVVKVNFVFVTKGMKWVRYGSQPF